MNNFKLFIEENKQSFNDYANNYITSLTMPNELKESIKYSLINDGKKIRPLSFLYLLNSYGEEYRNYFSVALAIELVHTYSLVHDDLPAMDNDDFRWKKATNHKVFGEDMAILTGDAMLTLAFEVLIDSNISLDKKIKLTKMLANYSGLSGMIAGQVYDVKQANYTVDENYLKTMHSLKTGKLIVLPLLFATIISEKDNEQYEQVNYFGKQLGIAYQIKDDILDYYGEFEKTGKKFSDEHKITYLSFYGLDGSKELLEIHTKNAIDVANKLSNDSLVEFANYLLQRDR